MFLNDSKRAISERIPSRADNLKMLAGPTPSLMVSGRQLMTLMVEAKLLRFEGEYHGTTSKPSNYMRTILYMLSWYKDHSRAAAPTEASR